ncbi:MAG: hypothetical protein ACXVB9_03120 [Bdellovibrionota bacterium]
MNRLKYPANYEAIHREKTARQAAGRWNPSPPHLDPRASFPEPGVFCVKAAVSLPAVLFLPVWIFLWGIGGVGVLAKSGSFAFGVLWAFALFNAGFAFLWMVAGRERVVFTGDGLELRTEISGWAFRQRRYSRDNVLGFGIGTRQRRSRRLRRTILVIELRTRNGTVDFAHGISREEAEESLGRLEKAMTR